MSAAKYVQKFCKCARKGKIYFYYVKYLKYCLRKITNAYHCLVPQYENLHKFILKLMAIANVADFFYVKLQCTLMSATKYVKSYASVHERENLFLFSTPSGSTSFHFRLASTKCGSHPSHPLTRVYIYIATLHLAALFCLTVS